MQPKLQAAHREIRAQLQGEVEWMSSLDGFLVVVGSKCGIIP